MRRFDGTAARQLDLWDDPAGRAPREPAPVRPKPTLRLLQKDVYSELTRRRRRAQIRARHLIE
jgi:hypothetical protein